ncbi:hypothetical protein DRQ33_06805 [bacterium]|nr:MAG: hypothetical protein DRQ33_06805 [bacterium]
MESKIYEEILQSIDCGIVLKNKDDEIIFENEIGKKLRSLEADEDGYVENEGEHYLLVKKSISSGELYIWKNATELFNNKKLMIIDPELGIFNERFMREELERELDRVHRTGSQMALVLVDIDCGEEQVCMVDVANALKHSVRIYDKVFRGDRSDFVLMLFAMDPENAYATGERLLKTLKELGIARVSIGMTLSEKSPSAEAMMRQAQRALYVVNTRGGNDFSIY